MEMDASVRKPPLTPLFKEGNRIWKRDEDMG
jgi:hypothetical protein